MLSNTANEFIHNAVKKKVDVIVDQKTILQVVEARTAEIKEISEHVEKQILGSLTDKIDLLIKQRFAAAFGGNG